MKKQTLITFILILTGTILIYGQSGDTTKSEAIEKFYAVDIPPQFPGGIVGLYKYINKNLVYPKDARKKGIEGSVKVEFVVDSVGVINPATINVVQSLYKSCDDEALRLIAGSPNWTPGRSTELNKNVKVKMTIPIQFKP